MGFVDGTIVGLADIDCIDNVEFEVGSGDIDGEVDSKAVGSKLNTVTFSS